MRLPFKNYEIKFANENELTRRKKQTEIEKAPPLPEVEI